MNGEPQLEVVWNGAHHDCDADLLDVTLRIGPKREPRQPPRTASVPFVDRVLAVLPADQEHAVSFVEVVERTGLAKKAANSALYALWRGGKAGKIRQLGADGTAWRRWRVRFWRTEARA